MPVGNEVNPPAYGREAEQEILTRQSQLQAQYRICWPFEVLRELMRRILPASGYSIISDAKNGTTAVVLVVALSSRLEGIDQRRAGFGSARVIGTCSATATGPRKQPGSATRRWPDLQSSTGDGRPRKRRKPPVIVGNSIRLVSGVELGDALG
jgi:hypothetical protein